MNKHPLIIFSVLIIFALGGIVGYFWATRQLSVATSVFRTEGVEAIKFEEVFDVPTDEIGYENPISDVTLNPFTE